MADAVPPSMLGAVETSHTESQVYLRRRIFYGVFVFLWVLYACLVITFWFVRPVSLWTIQAVALMAPTIKADIPVLGDLVPAVLGAVIAATAPQTATNRQLLTVLACALVTYGLYVHMTVFLAPAASPDFLATKGLYTGITSLGLSVEDIDTVRSLATSARSFSVFVFAALVGIRFNNSPAVVVPFLGRGTPQSTTSPSSPVQDDQKEPARIPPKSQYPSTDESDGAADLGASNG